MKVPIYQVDAFADKQFSGNPAAVCTLPSWLPDDLLQAIAAENNVSETAFLVPSRTNGIDFDLRWFTPTVEVELCGHATLASGYVLVEKLGFLKHKVVYSTKSGLLNTERRGELYWVDLPAVMPEPLAAADVPADLRSGLRAEPTEFWVSGNKYMAVFETAKQIADLAPDLAAFGRLAGKGIIVTAPGAGYEVDFVSRYFTPACGVDEDPVTGSAHSRLVPYWAKKLGKERFEAMQLSRRGGRLQASLLGERIALGGRVQPYLKGELLVEMRRKPGNAAARKSPK
jgi:PhzF family phenazine biosynthesis protein